MGVKRSGVRKWTFQGKSQCILIAHSGPNEAVNTSKKCIHVAAWLLLLWIFISFVSEMCCDGWDWRSPSYKLTLTFRLNNKHATLFTQKIQKLWFIQKILCHAFDDFLLFVFHILGWLKAVETWTKCVFFIHFAGSLGSRGQQQIQLVSTSHRGLEEPADTELAGGGTHKGQVSWPLLFQWATTWRLKG